MTDQPARTEQDERAALQDFSQAKSADKLSMHVRIYAPFREYYDGPAFSISAENATGPFDVLPKHHNFISLLLPCDLVLRTVSKGDQTIRISGGIIHVKTDEVIIFLDV
jgi:F0F1-type ATP synthase epsilon subunit